MALCHGATSLAWLATLPGVFSVLFVMNSYEFMRTSDSQREMSAYHHDLQS